MVSTNSRKKPKTLSGIETKLECLAVILAIQAGKNLKPYQGLKQNLISVARSFTHYSRKKPKTLSGIETITSILNLLKFTPEKT